MDEKTLIWRIERRLSALGISRNAASEAAGLGRDYIRNIASGKSKNPKSDELAKLARVLGCRLEWLRLGEGQEVDPSDEPPSPSLPATPEAIPALDDGIFELSKTEFVSIPRYDAALSAGHGAIVDPYAEPLGWAVFERQWLATVTRAMPQYLAVLQVDGDSMESTLNDRDWVLVDRTQTRLNRSGIYALQVGDAAWIKRIELDLERKLVQIISDNPKYGVQRLDESEICVIGRVVWVVGRRI